MKRSDIALTLAGVLAATMVSACSPSAEDTVLLPVKNDPSISFRIWFKVGSQNDPVGKEGLAQLTASMLTDASTTNNSYEEILDKLYPLAANYDAATSVEMTVASGRTHRDNVLEFYPLFMDALLRPAFREEDLERIRSQMLNYLENSLRYASDEDLGKAVLYNDIFAGTPYGHLTAGTVKGIRSITIDDIRSFYQQHFTRENFVIGLAGSYDDNLLEMIRGDLASLPEGHGLQIDKPKPAPIDGMQVTIVEKDAPATAISMGFPIDIVRGSREWYALAVANSWLGEHRNSSSHLYQVIREERGLNYGDYSYIENFPEGSRRQMPPQNVSRRQQIFEIWIRPVPHEVRHFAIRAALREFRMLVENGMTGEDFELTRNFLSKYVLHYAPTTMERLGYALDDRFYGVQGSHLELFRKMMGEVTLEDVNSAIRKYWQYGNMQIAIITKDAEGMKEMLVSDVESPITYSSPKAASVLEEDKEIIRFPLDIKAENVKIVEVGGLFEE
ncbi:MAG: insulinase family protein [Ignavibacteria bacterium]|nr:insulinase family protein [Ignavibacteria bacterium]